MATKLLSIKQTPTHKHLCMPSQYKYCVVIHSTDSIFSMLLDVYPETTQDIQRVTGNRGSTLYPYTGELVVGPHKMWVVEKNPNYHLFFENKGQFTEFIKDVESKRKAMQPKQEPPVQPKSINIYTWEGGRWVGRAHNDISNYELIGYSDYLTQIKQEITMHSNHIDLLRSIGESRSINYLEVGPPGVGKTTLIKALASQLNLPVFIVNAQTVSSYSLKDMLNPVIGSYNGMLLVLFEDFDRFLVGHKDMSGLLNALDGIDDRYNVVRVFTGNDTKLIQDTPALMNRMTRIFQFHYPTQEHFNAKFQFLRSKCGVSPPDVALYDEFMAYVSSVPNLTLRPYTKYVMRYILASAFGGKDDYMEDMLKNMEQLATSIAPVDTT